MQMDRMAKQWNDHPDKLRTTSGQGPTLLYEFRVLGH